jgi:hypothetical protein
MNSLRRQVAAAVKQAGYLRVPDAEDSSAEGINNAEEDCDYEAAGRARV